MGWVANDPTEGDGDRFPVETMVNKLQSKLRETNEACTVYNGQTKQCCDGIRICLVQLADSFTVVRLQAIGNQDMHHACSTVESEISAARSCVVTWAGKCHHTVDGVTIAEPFLQNLEELDEQHTDSCSNLPPERTTVILTTTSPTSLPTISSSSLTSLSTVVMETTGNNVHTQVANGTLPKSGYSQDISTLPESTWTPSTQTSSLKTSPTTSLSPTSSVHVSSTDLTGNGSLNDSFKNDVTSLADTDDTVIIVSSVVGGILLCLIAIVLLLIVKRRKREKCDECDNKTSDKSSVSNYVWKCFQIKKRQTGTNETEIYAEIDEAFMEAVYDADKREKKSKNRGRIPSASQMNICYEAPNNDYVITSSVNPSDVSPRRISSRSAHQSPEKRLSTSNIKVNFCYEAPNDDDVIIVSTHSAASKNSKGPKQLDLIRKRDDMVTSFQISQTGLVTSRPSFTAISNEVQKESVNEYNYIETPYATPDEPIYAVLENEHQYDVSNIAQIFNANDQNNDYVSLKEKAHEYKNTDEVTYHARKYTNVGSHVPEYVTAADLKKNKKNDKKRDKRKKAEEENVYENDDTMMVY